MSQLKTVKQQLSFIFGKKPIVYFVSEDVDFPDMLFEYDPGFCPIDFVNGEKVPIDKHKYVRENYNSAKSTFWRSLVNEYGEVGVPPEFKGNPTYCYIKNFNYIFELNNRSKELELYSCLMRYVSGYNALSEEKKAENILILCGNAFSVPEGIAPFVEVVDVPYPDEEDIGLWFEKLGVVNEKTPEKLRAFWKTRYVGMKGFTNLQISDILKMILTYYPNVATMSEGLFEKRREEIERFVRDIVNEQKLQMVKKNGVLQFIDYPATVYASGCGNIERFMENKKKIFLDPKQFPGAKPPRGILFAGVPGTGKSLMAQKIASILGVPLLKMDMGSLMGKYVGESDGKLRRALKMAESVAPCVLFIDELEKAFSTGNDSNEVSKRMFGYMLGWMQDCKKSVFIYATANHIDRIDGAFKRSGRFDSKFFAFMPNRNQCVDIFVSCLQKRIADMKKQGVDMFEGGRNADRFESSIERVLDIAAQDGRFMTGSDIDGWINLCVSALYNDNLFPPYSEADFFAVLKDELSGLNSYGKTQMSEVAAYWLLNKFSSIEPSDELLFPYDDFDLDRKKPGAPKEKPGESYFKERSRGSFSSEYDYRLYRAIVTAVDKLSYDEIRYKYMSAE